MADFPFGEPPFDIESVRDVSRPCYGTPASDVAKFQEYVIRQRRPAWWAREKFKIGYKGSLQRTSSSWRDLPAGPVWCFTRFGRTVTPLPSGALLYVGGEHEDFYDPDFCIYNDAVIETADGAIYIIGFPKDVFPPTDFHTATLVGSDVWVIGSLGYLDQRRECETQVIRLTIDDLGDPEELTAQTVDTTGDNPGWVSRHEARYVRGRNEIVVWGGQVWETRNGELDLHDNHSGFALSLDSMEWRRMGFDEAADA